MEATELLRLAREGAPLERQREALVEVLTAAGVAEPEARAAVALARDGVALLEEGDGRSRIGGDPLLPAGEGWPHDPEGAPLAFIARLELDELPHVEPLPEGGTLLVFFDQLFFELDAMDFVVATRVFHVAPGGATEPHDPPDPDERYAPVPLTGLVMPLLGDLGRMEDESDELYDAADAVFGLWSHQLLGAPQEVQAPVLDEIPYWFEEAFPDTRERYSEAERRGEGWTLLAEIDSTGDLMFGDAGALYLVIPDADLRARRFDRVMGIMQSA